MEQPTNSTGQQQNPGKVCKLQKSVYGINQAGNIWGSIVHSHLNSTGFKISAFDQRVYFFRKHQSFIIIAIVVDDMALASNDSALREDFKESIAAVFKVSIFREIQTFLGWRVTRNRTVIRIDQELYRKSLIQMCNMDHSKHLRSPIAIKADTGRRNCHEQSLDTRAHSRYRSIIGGLMYLATSIRPDLKFPVSVLARQMRDSFLRNCQHAKRVLRYPAGSAVLGMNYHRSGTEGSTFGGVAQAGKIGDR